MRILIVPMAALAETHGPVARCQTMAYGFMNAGLDATESGRPLYKSLVFKESEECMVLTI